MRNDSGWKCVQLHDTPQIRASAINTAVLLTIFLSLFFRQSKAKARIKSKVLLQIAFPTLFFRISSQVRSNFACTGLEVLFPATLSPSSYFSSEMSPPDATSTWIYYASVTSGIRKPLSRIQNPFNFLPIFTRLRGYYITRSMSTGCFTRR